MQPVKNVVEPRVGYVTGSISAGARQIPVVSTRLSARDVLGGWRVRWSLGRTRYSVRPGVYAVGAPSQESPVLVTANYKLSFDRLRSELTGIDAWILVLDTKGINVWCAAGKGTFGTRELEQKLLAFRVDQLVSHRTLILPQLGATGVSAPQVRQGSGYRVVFGPVRARDIPAFLAAGMKKDPSMRCMDFRFRDRIVLAPVELVHSWPFILGILAAAAAAALPLDPGYAGRILSLLIPLLGSVIAGSVLVPALLPYLPFQAFALKGAAIGAVWAAAASLVLRTGFIAGAGLTLVGASIAAYLAMNFTGASTFTCQAGAELEVRRGAVPMIVSLVLGVGLFAVQRLL